MARKPRFTLAGYPRHIISVAWTGRRASLQPQIIGSILSCCRKRLKNMIVTYTPAFLMTNHVHMLVTPQRSLGISFMMQRLARRYVRQINRTYR